MTTPENYFVEGSNVQYFFDIEDQNGIPIDLTGATVRLEGEFTKPCVIEDAAAGKASIWLGPSELSRIDHLYQSDVVITMPDGKIFKPYEKLEFYVRGAL
jgi:hypothetical protein